MTKTTVLISTYLEPEHVSTIESAAPDIEVLYEPELLPSPRYVADHGGVRPTLSDSQQERWDALVRRADVAFDFDWQDPASLPHRAPNLAWVQATSAGIGGFMRRTGLDRSKLVVTTAAGTHAVPLAEFALSGALYFVKGVPHLRNQQREHRWERYTTRQLSGMSVSVVGVGAIGRNVIRVFSAMGARVTAVGRVGGSYDLGTDVRVSDIQQLDDVLVHSDIVVLCAALTDETEGLIDARRVALLPPGAIVVNIARGQVIDEDALVAALQSGALGGACLDVFREEPLPTDSPLWDLENVLISPHSASTVRTENETLTKLFIENLGRFRSGSAMINQYDPVRGY
jgi:glyoxylate/hydroxypyruvate reductase